jgi:hypothetical protein
MRLIKDKRFGIKIISIPNITKIKRDIIKAIKILKNHAAAE